MNFKRKRYVHAEVQAGALNDILFFLMLFFLMISTLASPNAINLLLPKASTGKSIPSQVINVSISGDLKYYVNTDEVSYADMEVKLKKEAMKLQNPSVVLRADNTISVQEMVKVIDVLNRAKIPMVMAVDKPQ